MAAICAVTVQNTELLTKKGYFRASVPVNILLVDMGAGTTDLVLCRHIPGNEPKTETLCTWPKKGSATFGGSEVDELLKQYILSNVPGEAAGKSRGIPKAGAFMSGGSANRGTQGPYIC